MLTFFIFKVKTPAASLKFNQNRLIGIETFLHNVTKMLQLCDFAFEELTDDEKRQVYSACNIFIVKFFVSKKTVKHLHRNTPKEGGELF